MCNELPEAIACLIEQIKELAPEARVVDTGLAFADEDTNMEIYPPLAWTEEQCRALQREIADRAVDILIDTDYLILTYVCKPEQQVAAAQLEFERATQRVRKAEQVLSEAKSLGLIQPSLNQMELVPV